VRIFGFPAIVTTNSKILVLGTIPGNESIKRGEYYANSRNQFWFIMGEICDAKPQLSYLQRKVKIEESGIAVWDVLKSCVRSGSSDKSITSPQPNDFRSFFLLHPAICAILFNGNRARKYFSKRVIPQLDSNLSNLILITLPSTSSTNTTKNKNAKLHEWQEAISHLL